MHWSRQYKVWLLDEFVNQNLGFDASKPERRLLKPHLTEKLVMVTLLTFPLKAEYERMNTTLEGMKERDRLGGEPSKLPAPDEDGGDRDEIEDQDDDDQDDDDSGDGGHGPDGKSMKKKKYTKSHPGGSHHSEEPTLEELIAQQPDHWKKGKARDGIVYLNDISERGTSPEEWAELSQADRNAIKKVEKKKLEKKAAKEKEERIVKETKKKALADKKKEKKAKTEKKEKKPDSEVDKEDDGGIFDDSAFEPKHKDADVGVGVKDVKDVKVERKKKCCQVNVRVWTSSCTTLLMMNYLEGNVLLIAEDVTLMQVHVPISLQMWADFYRCLPSHSVKLADAIQAYIQDKLKGLLCWVELPTDAWPAGIPYWKYRRPVVRLDKAFYGHPDSGTMLEQHCDEKVQQIAFKPIGEEWPSMYFHDELKLLLVIYVDDLKLAGPSGYLAKGWDMIRTVLRIEPEADLELYLGCVLSLDEAKLHDGKKVKTITYNREGLLKLSVEKYLDIVGKDTKFKKVSTPSLPEETQSSPYRAPVEGKQCVQCAWCAHSFDPTSIVFSGATDSPRGQESEQEVRGTLAPHAASVLMKLLYAARIARFDFRLVEIH
eukprot:s290_g28.t1